MALQEEFEEQGIWLFRYRGHLPIFILVIGLILYLQAEIQTEALFFKSPPYEIYFEMICLFISLIGLFIRVYTVGRTPFNTSGRNITGQVADALNTTGIYSVVRHPLYLGNFLMWMGPAMLTGNLWFVIAFCLFFWVYYERIMFAEEQFLRKKFGESYINWAQNVPAFIPNFKNFTKSSLPFSWKKVLEQEKNGLFALFLIFSLFDILGELIKKETNFNYPMLFACILTGISYLIFKYVNWE